MTVSTESKPVTLINMFPVRPEQQQEFIEVMIQTAEETARHQPGFISAHLYRSLDGKLVANYVQWRSKEDLDRMRQSPEMQKHVEAIHKITRGNPNLFELCNVTMGVEEAAAAPANSR